MTETRHQHHVRFYLKGAWVMLRLTVNPKDFNQSQASIRYHDGDDGWKDVDPKEVASFGTIIFLDEITEDWYR